MFSRPLPAASSAFDAMMQSAVLVNPLKFDLNAYFISQPEKKGKCRVCGKVVPWMRDRAISHKVSGNCGGQDPAEKKLFVELKRLKAGKKVVAVLEKRTALDSPKDYGVSTAKRSRLQSTASFVDSVTSDQAEKLEALLCDLVFRTGIPFRVVDSAAMKAFVEELRPSYAPIMPSAKSVTGKHLNRKYNMLMEKMEGAIAEANWYSVIRDGWSYSRNAHFVNYIIIIPGCKPFFYKTVHTGGVSQSGEIVAASILEVIQKFGPERCPSVITDNAPVMQVAWEIIERRYPIVFANGCAAHVMNLLIKNVCKLPEISGVLDKLNTVVKFVNDHKFTVAEFGRLQKVMKIKNALSLPCSMRWYTHFSACRNLHKAKLAVCTLAQSEGAKVLKLIKNKKVVHRFKKIAKNKSFWTKLAKLTRLLKFPSGLIGKLESDSGDLFRVYESFVRLKGSWVDDASLRYGDAVGQVLKVIVLERWRFLHTPSMGYAYLLTPASKLLESDEDDKLESTTQLKAFIPKLYQRKTEADACRVELDKYITMESDCRADKFIAFTKMTGLAYWLHYGRARFPKLAAIVLRVLRIPTSSAAAERVWSTYGFLWSKRRNQMTERTVEKLAFSYINSSLLDEADDHDCFDDLLDNFDLDINSDDGSVQGAGGGSSVDDTSSSSAAYSDGCSVGELSSEEEENVSSDDEVIVRL